MSEARAPAPHVGLARGSRVKILTAILAGMLLAVAGCGDDQATSPRSQQPRDLATPTPTVEAEPRATEEATKPERRGTEVVVGDSEFGEMLFDSKKQAIYIFENDLKGETVCYDDCAEAWPPVYTKGEPVAGKGVKASLLGTVKRRDGRLQVAYAGKPLYYYAHEGPGEVRCHNINLNGGLWWVVGPDGRRRP